jgi:hypothetical protein
MIVWQQPEPTLYLLTSTYASFDTTIRSIKKLNEEEMGIHSIVGVHKFSERLIDEQDYALDRLIKIARERFKSADADLKIETKEVIDGSNHG